MNDQVPPGRSRRFDNVGQRVLSILLFVVLAYLIWLAVTGQFDTEINRFADWLRRRFDALLRLF